MMAKCSMHELPQTSLEGVFGVREAPEGEEGAAEGGRPLGWHVQARDRMPMDLLSLVGEEQRVRPRGLEVQGGSAGEVLPGSLGVCGVVCMPRQHGCRCNDPAWRCAGACCCSRCRARRPGEEGRPCSGGGGEGGGCTGGGGRRCLTAGVHFRSLPCWPRSAIRCGLQGSAKVLSTYVLPVIAKREGSSPSVAIDR